MSRIRSSSLMTVTAAPRASKAVIRCFSSTRMREARIPTRVVMVGMCSCGCWPLFAVIFFGHRRDFERQWAGTDHFEIGAAVRARDNLAAHDVIQRNLSFTFGATGSHRQLSLPIWSETFTVTDNKKPLRFGLP